MPPGGREAFASGQLRLMPSSEIIEIFGELFRRGTGEETILPGDETISAFSRRHLETPAGYQSGNETAGQRRQATPETVRCEPSA
jgi:hypothetical protein